MQRGQPSDTFIKALSVTQGIARPSRGHQTVHWEAQPQFPFLHTLGCPPASFPVTLLQQKVN